MKSSSSAICFLLLTLGLVLILAPNHAEATATVVAGKSGSLIAGVCGESLANMAKCNLLLAANPRIAQAKNYRQLSKLILQMALNKAIAGQNLLKGLTILDKTGLTAFVGKTHPAILECANVHYNGVVASFRSALGELSVDPMTANYDAKVAVDGVEACNLGLAKANIVNPAIATLNTEIALFSNVAFLATNHLS